MSFDKGVLKQLIEKASIYLGLGILFAIAGPLIGVCGILLAAALSSIWGLTFDLESILGWLSGGVVIFVLGTVFAYLLVTIPAFLSGVLYTLFLRIFYPARESPLIFRMVSGFISGGLPLLIVYSSNGNRLVLAFIGSCSGVLLSLFVSSAAYVDIKKTGGWHYYDEHS